MLSVAIHLNDYIVVIFCSVQKAKLHRASDTQVNNVLEEYGAR